MALLLLSTATSSFADLDGVYDSMKRDFNAAVGPACVCNCAYPKNPQISVPRYYESGASDSCDKIDGQACLANHRGTLFKGLTQSCEVGPRPVDINSADGEIMRVPIGSEYVSSS